MKKAFVAGLLAVALIAVTQQQASAWHNNRFSIGLNWSHQSGGNSCFWGAFHNGQLPGPEAYGYGYGQDQRSHFHTQPQYYHGPSHHHAMESYEVPSYQYAQPAYASPYQFATYPRPLYYYPTPYYYYYVR